MTFLELWVRPYRKKGAVHKNLQGVLRPRQPRLPPEKKLRPMRPPWSKWVAAHYRWDHWKKDWILVDGHWVKRNIRSLLDKPVTVGRRSMKGNKKSGLLLDAETLLRQYFYD